MRPDCQGFGWLAKWDDMKTSKTTNRLGWISFALTFIWPAAALVAGFRISPPSHPGDIWVEQAWAIFLAPTIFFGLSTSVLLVGDYIRLSKVMHGLSSICFALTFLLMPIAFLGLAISAIFGPLFEALVNVSFVAFIALFFFFIAGFCLLFGSQAARAAGSRSILARGKSSEAKILKISETGLTINDRPLVRFLLEVHPADRPRFQAETEKVISPLDIPRIQPGTVISVKYDPSNKTVALVWPD
jgi:hypothetical protein